MVVVDGHVDARDHRRRRRGLGDLVAAAAWADRVAVERVGRAVDGGRPVDAARPLRVQHGGAARRGTPSDDPAVAARRRRRRRASV